MSMGAVKARVERSTGGAFVYSVEVGASVAADTENGFVGNVHEQVAGVCEKIGAEPRLAGGFHAVGFSQGGLFVRALTETCAAAKVRSLVTLGGPHWGVAEVPGCDVQPAAVSFCRAMQKALAVGAYAPEVRTHVVQAQYARFPSQLDAYLKHNPFLPDVNNEKAVNPDYKARLAAVDNLVLIRFSEDATVVPRDSAWFSQFNGTAVVPLVSQPLYTEDWLGLRALDEAGKLHFDEAPGQHMHFTLDWFDAHVVEKYLKAPPGAVQRAPRRVSVA